MEDMFAKPPATDRQSYLRLIEKKQEQCFGVALRSPKRVYSAKGFHLHKLNDTESYRIQNEKLRTHIMKLERLLDSHNIEYEPINLD